MSLFTWLFGKKPKVEVKKKVQPVRKVTVIGSNNKSSLYDTQRKYGSIDTNNNISNIMNLDLLVDTMENNTPEPTKEFDGGFGGGRFSGGGAGGNWEESPSYSNQNDYPSNDYSSTSHSSSDYSSNSSSDSTSYSSDSSSNDY